MAVRSHVQEAGQPIAQPGAHANGSSGRAGRGLGCVATGMPSGVTCCLAEAAPGCPAGTSLASSRALVHHILGGSPHTCTLSPWQVSVHECVHPAQPAAEGVHQPGGGAAPHLHGRQQGPDHHLPRRQAARAQAALCARRRHARHEGGRRCMLHPSMLHVGNGSWGLQEVVARTRGQLGHRFLLHRKGAVARAIFLHARLRMESGGLGILFAGSHDPSLSASQRAEAAAAAAAAAAPASQAPYPC